MKQFDLKLAKAGHPICTRDGRKARILCFDLENEHPIVCAVADIGGKEAVVTYNVDGTSYHPSKDFDLMMASTKHEGWVNVYQYTMGHYSTGQRIYRCEEDAKNSAKDAAAYIATVKIEWEE